VKHVTRIESGGAVGMVHGDKKPNAKDRAALERVVVALDLRKQELLLQLRDVNAKLDGYKFKCPTCRCRILPWEVCRCCAEPACVDDESPI
jgi:hypothetical protein